MYDLEIKPAADKIFKKIAKKNPNQLRTINKKIKQIRTNPYRAYKFLRNPLQNFNRAHIGRHFVLIFRIDHSRKVVVIYTFKHHDTVYNWRE